jgi:hypothetical protein
MDEIKNQHVVPRGYLKRFALDDQIHVLSKDSAKTFLTNIKNVACERGFYDIVSCGGEGHVHGQIVEKALSDIDDRFVGCRDAFLQEGDRCPQFSVEHKVRLVEFLAVQFLRTQVMRRAIRDVGEAEVPTAGADSILAESLRVPAESISSVHAGIIFQPERRLEIESVLLGHVWLLGVNHTDMAYLTSDSPVIQISHVSDALGPVCGVASEGSEIAWPLSPSHILLLYERSHHQHLEQVENRVLDIRDAHKHVLPYNQRQVTQSFRQIYSADGQFRPALELLQKNQSLRDVHRSRVELVSESPKQA